ncbi:MAG: pilus assembly protein [Kiritimatiellae bacterium]|nr:pilus assembly protein [Kiritimatiellia bacterium]
MTARGTRKGSVLMEFVLSMPIMITLIFLVVQFAQVWTARQMVSYAAFCATRSMLSANPKEWQNGGKTSRCDHVAASRVLAWVNIYGPGDTMMVPGWGKIPQSSSVDDRLEVESNHVEGQYATSKVKYKFPLLIPVAGQMVSYLAQHSANEAKYMSSGTPETMWSGEEELFDDVPYIELTETCVLPLPYDPSSQPENAYTYN